jgi:hypothetical protein
LKRPDLRQLSCLTSCLLRPATTAVPQPAALMAAMAVKRRKVKKKEAGGTKRGESPCLTVVASARQRDAITSRQKANFMLVVY